MDPEHQASLNTVEEPPRVNAADHLGLVRLFVARRCQPTDDILAAATVGLVLAARKADNRAKFSTYARFYIEAYARREQIQETQAWTRHLLGEAERRYTVKTFTFSELGPGFDRCTDPVFAVDVPMRMAPDPARSAGVTKALGRLDKRSRQVIRMRFGWGGVEPATLQEIGVVLGLSKARIRQIEWYALRTLRWVLVHERRKKRWLSTRCWLTNADIEQELL